MTARVTVRAASVHEFASSGQAYDASQTHEEIKNGDVLWVPSEGVAAVLVEAWPVAVTEGDPGEFHTPGPDFEWSAVEQVVGGARWDYTASVEAARKVAAEAAR